MVEETFEEESQDKAVKGLPPFLQSILSYVVTWAKSNPDVIISWILSVLPGSPSGEVKTRIEAFKALPSQETLLALVNSVEAAGGNSREVAAKLVKEAR